MTNTVELVSSHGAELLLERLVAHCALDTVSVSRAHQAAEGSGERIDRVLVKLGLADEIAVAKAWSAISNIPLLEELNLPPEPILAETLSAKFLLKAEVLPVAVDEATLTIAIVDPLDRHTPAALAQRTGLAIRPLLMTKASFETAFSRLYAQTPAQDTPLGGSAEIASSDAQRLQDFSTDAPAIRLIHETIERAVEIRASDIHLTIARNGPRLRYRVDGMLNDAPPPPAHIYPSLISRLKVLADLDIAESRLPQDGRIRYGVRGREIDLRIATMPHLDGEGAVIRILDRKAVKLDLPELGFPSPIETEILNILSEPHGLFLVTGPTGSGKTTTLYAALRHLVQPHRNLLSVEEPVEYQLDGVAQIQVQRKIGLDFPAVLRSVLRQDPDIIMIGEIRDGETAAIANQAALTGHFVLATLHTNSAAASPPRLVDMGLEPYLLSSTLRGVLAQRLVRALCPNCARPADRPELSANRIAEALGGPPSGSHASRGIKEPAGCEKCSRTGYLGRFAVAELLSVSDDIREAILRRADAGEIEALALRGRMAGMAEACANAVLSGKTSLTEFFRIAGERTKP